MSKQAHIYMRVSKSKTQDTRSQEPDLTRWADAYGKPVKWHADKLTGRVMDRPQWQELEAAMLRGEVSDIVVWRLDRLGRTAKGLTALFDELRQRKVNLISLKEGFDLSTAAGRLMANVLASVAQFESELKSERILAGIEAAKAAGKRWGGSKKGKRRVVTPLQVRTIRRLKQEGEPIAAIARAVKLSRPTIYAVLAE